MNACKSFSLLHVVASATLMFGAVMSADAQINLPSPPSAQALNPTDEEMFPDPSGPPVGLQWGASLAVKDDMALIGAPAYGGGTSYGSPIGRVAVFSRDASGVWSRSGTLEPVAPEPGEHFGRHVAVGKQLALVNSDRFVYVFKLSHGQWQEEQRIEPKPEEAFDGALGVAGGEIFIGRSAEGASGAIYVLGRDRRGTWKRVQTLHASGGGSEGDLFGASLMVRGDSLVVGASGAEDGAGAAFVFHQVNERWVRVATLKSPHAGQAGAFGSSVALHGNLIAIGAPATHVLDDVSCIGYPGSGAAYVFRYVRGRWLSEQEVLAPQAECYTAVGDSVGINHQYLAVAVPTNYPFANGGGVVYSRSNAGYQPTYLAAESDWSGTTLAMQGATLLVGRPYAQHFGSGDVTAFSLDEMQ
jgi:hypothetical protein